MGSKTTLALALMSTAGLAAAGISLALYITRAQPEPISVTVTRSVTEALTRTVTEASPAKNEPPALSADGRLIWQLEALLRDTFGRAEFYLHYEDDIARFDYEFTGNCCSEYWNFVFADARESQLRLGYPGRELRAKIGASGGAIPVMLLDQYIECGDGKWLYTGVGHASSPNFYAFCESA